MPEEKKAPAAAPKAEGNVAQEAADLELIARTVRNNRGVDEAKARQAIKHLLDNPGEDWETAEGTWTMDVSNTPVLHPKPEEE